MEQLLPRTLIVSALALCFGTFAVGACTHTTSRVVEPVGGGDASPSVPDSSDASITPIGPIARSLPAPAQEPAPDFTLFRSPELGSAVPSDMRRVKGLALDSRDALPSMGGGAGTGGNGAGGGGGNNSRPVATGGMSYF